MSETTENKLTPKQIKNWRGVLVAYVGAYALIMPEEKIQEFRDRFQDSIDNLDQKYREPECPFEVGDTVNVMGQGKGVVMECHGNQMTVKWSYGGRGRVSVHGAEKL